MSASQAASLASAAGNAASGNFVQAAANLVAAIAGGGKKTPSVLQGFDVQGTFGTSGFSGTVTAFDQKGNRWDQPLESQWLGSLGTGLLTSGKYGPPVDANSLASLLAATGPIPVSVTVPGDSTYPQHLTASILDDLSNKATMNAPSINSATGTPTAETPAAAASASAGNLGAAAFARLDQILVLVAVVGGILWALKKG